MVHKPALLGFALITGVAGLTAFAPTIQAQSSAPLMDPGEAQEQLDRALKASEEAQARAVRFTSQAKEASEEADRAARESAALAAQIQASQARTQAARARYSLAQVERARLAQDLARRQEPLVRLTAALQTSARRPLTLSALQPGSLKDLVYVRAVLDSAVPEIQTRTKALRDELEQGRRLERRARLALTQMRESERDLRDQRTQLTAIVAQQRLATKAARASAAREADRALILAEDARDLDGLIARLDENALRRRILSGLPGPVLRPALLSPDTELDLAASPSPLSSPETPLAQQTGLGDFQLPVAGQTLIGFGEERASGLRSKGVQLIPNPGAQLVVPAAGRVVFAGPYEGFGRIAIIEHPAGWSSLVTGLATIDVAVGDRVVIGAPLGLAGQAGSVIGIELRKDGKPVNPLDYLSN